MFVIGRAFFIKFVKRGLKNSRLKVSQLDRLRAARLLLLLLLLCNQVAADASEHVAERTLPPGKILDEPGLDCQLLFRRGTEWRGQIGTTGEGRCC